MGNPVFKFTLTHGSLGSMVISEPDGWKDAKLKMERHPDFHSLVEYFEGSFVFYGENNVDNGGADFVRQCENLDGADAEIEILIEADINGDGVYEETIFDGLLDLTQLKEVQDNKISIPIIRNDMWSKFIARKDTPVNLRSTTDLDGNAVAVTDHVDINLTSQKIRKIYHAYVGSPSFSYAAFTNNSYYAIDFNDVIILDEFDARYSIPRVDSTERPGSNFVLEEGGTYTFDIRVMASHTNSMDLFAHSLKNPTDYIDYYIQFNDQTPIAFAFSDVTFGSGTRTLFTYSGSLTLNPNTEIRIYGKANTTTTDDLIVTGGDSPYVPTEFSSYCKIIADTTYPSSTAQAYLIHDAADAIIRRIANPDGLWSEHLGSTITSARQYDADGCACKNVIMPGLQIRGYTFDQKQFAMSFMKWWSGANPLFNLGLGYETISGTEYISIEDVAEFYDATSTSAYFENVRQISREYDLSLLYNHIQSGFQKWQSEDISGLDDPQTKRDWATPGRTFDKLLQIMSDWIAASIAIEATRRKVITNSEDYKYDNEVFIIAINDTPVSPDRFTPELNENFNSITGLINSDARYNLIHTPLRMLLRWGAWWNSCLQNYQSSSLKFVSGEGNYDMVSDYSCASGDQCLAIICDPLSEKQDVSMASYGQVFGYLHLPLLYTIEIINFSWEDYLLIRNNRKKAIGISQTIDNFKRFFIKELTYDVCKGKCKIIAWPYDESPISIIETEMPERTEGEDPSVYDAGYQAILDYADSIC